MIFNDVNEGLFLNSLESSEKNTKLPTILAYFLSTIQTDFLGSYRIVD